MKAAKATILALLSCWAFAASAQVAVPPLTGRVIDQTATLSGNVVALAAARLDLEAGGSWS